MCAAVPEPQTPVDLLDGFDESPAAYLRTARGLAALPNRGHSTVRVTLLSTFTSEVLVPYLRVEGARRGLDLEAEAAPFGQLEQQALDANSAMYAGSSELIVLAWRLEDVSRSLVYDYLRL